MAIDAYVRSNVPVSFRARREYGNMSDLPDYMRTVRSVYGSAQLSSVSKPVAAYSTVIIADITGKGQIYTGETYVMGWPNHYYDSIELLIDGDVIVSEPWCNLNTHNLGRHGDSMLHLANYDSYNGTYVLCNRYGITFDKSFQMKYINVLADAITVHCKIVYALIRPT